MSFEKPEKVAVSTLSYAQRPKWHRRKRYRRIVYALLIVTGTAFIWLKREELKTEAEFLYWQHQCLYHTAAADQIVAIDDTDDRLTSFLNVNPEFVGDPFYSVDGVFPHWRFRPVEAWVRYSSFVDSAWPPAFDAGPKEGEAFYTVWPKPTNQSAVAFLHSRTSRNHQKRLVIVHVSEVQNEKYGPSWYLAAYVMHVGNFSAKQPLIWAGGLGIARFAVSTTTLMPKAESSPDLFSSIIYAGQIDTNDASRFTIGYAIHHYWGTIIGQLLDDDHVKLTVQDGPAANTSGSWSIDSPYLEDGF